MNTIRMIAIALPMTLLLACGGGGSGGNTASVSPATTPPTTMPPPTGGGGGGPTMPTGPQALPSALIADVATARSRISGSSAPTTTMPTEIQAAFQMEAMDADTLITSDAFVTNATSPSGTDMSTENNITLDDFTFSSSLANIRMEIADRFNLEGVSSQYSPVMDHQGVMLAQYQAAGRTDGNDVLEYKSYGGWLANSAFSVDMLTIDHGSREDSILIGISYGDATGSKPGGNLVQYRGIMAGINKNDGDVVQGTMTIDVAVPVNAINIAFNDIVNINDGSTVLEMQWNGLSISTAGTFSATTATLHSGVSIDADIEGTFYGTGHTEVGGTFNRNNIIGAFGGTRR